MKSADTQKQQALGQAILEYWGAYGTNLELPQGMSRTWHDLPKETQDTLKDKVFQLLIKRSDVDGILVKTDTIKFSINVSPSYLPVIYVKWGIKNVLIIPWLDLDGFSQGDFLDFCASLPIKTLVIAFTPQIYTQQYGEMVMLARSKNQTIIFSAPDDIDAIAKFSWSVIELINFKVTKVYLEGGVDADAIFSDWQVNRFREDMRQARANELLSVKKAMEIRKDEPERWLHHPELDNFREALKANNFALLVGKSASGKSILALSVAKRLISLGNKVWYVDIGHLTSKRAIVVGISIFKEALNSGKVIVILDDIHTQGSLAKSLVSFLRLLQSTLIDDQLCIIGICWPEFYSEYAQVFSGAFVLNVKASVMREALIREFGKGIDKENISLIRDQAGDDLYILRLWLENSSEGQLLDRNTLAKRVWASRSKDLHGTRLILERAVYLCYLIGQYECDIPIPFILSQAGASEAQVGELVRAKLLTKKGSLVSPPHRSFANLIATFLGQSKDIWLWFRGQKIANNSGELIVRYLEAIDPSQIWSTLKLIQGAGAIEKKKSSQDHIKMIMDIWTRIDALLQKMEEQQSEDPTWGRAMSSSYFACQALCTVGKKETARGSIEFIRECYYVENGKFEVDINKLSTVADFNEIRKRMALEEQEGAFPYQYNLETSETIDIDLFHANWACGLALGAEAYMRDLSENELQSLAIAAENRVEPGGYFYPARVPWVSARVLLGLSLCGRNIENSATIKRVADWLLKDRENGGAFEKFYWAPGTDGWNSILETTAMVILALRAVGVPSDNSVLQRATERIIDKKDDWTRLGFEMDGSFALEAYLSMTGDWSDVRSQALYLAHWADTIALWRNATESAQRTQEQSCRAASTAAMLIKGMWATIRRDVPKLIIAFGVAEDVIPKVSTAAIASPHEYDVVISYANEDRDYVTKFAKCLETSGVRVYFDKFEEYDSWGKDLYTYLDEIYRKKARFCIMFLSEYYAQKAWTNHERRSAQARAFQENKEYILPVRFDNTEIPGIPSTIKYIDANSVSPQKLCEMVQQKLAS